MKRKINRKKECTIIKERPRFASHGSMKKDAFLELETCLERTKIKKTLENFNQNALLLIKVTLIKISLFVCMYVCTYVSLSLSSLLFLELYTSKWLFYRLYSRGSLFLFFSLLATISWTIYIKVIILQALLAGFSLSLFLSPLPLPFYYKSVCCCVLVRNNASTRSSSSSSSTFFVQSSIIIIQTLAFESSPSS